MQMSQTRRDFTPLPQRERISLPARNQATLPRLSCLGHDQLTRARALATFENADIVGPSGTAMMAVVTNCCEFTA
jgi:hypothetical protein